MSVLRRVIERKGVFKFLYGDRASHFKTTRREGIQIDLDAIFGLKFERKVNSDNTTSFQKKIYEISPDSYRICFAKAAVEVRQLPSVKIKIFHKGRALKFTERERSHGN